MALQPSSSSLKVDDIISPLVSSVATLAHSLGADADAVSILKFMLDSIIILGEGVSSLIEALGDKGLGRENSEILDAYYEATVKCKTAALNTLRAASGSLTQLHNLQCVMQLPMGKEGLGASEREAAESLALNEIKHLDCSRFNLPDSLLSDLESAKAAYKEVICLCSKRKDKTGTTKIIAWVSISGLIVLGCVLTPAVVSLPFLIGAGEIVVETVLQVGFIVGGTMTLIGISSVLAKQVMDLCNLMKALKKQWELLQKAEAHAGGLILTMDQLQCQVMALQIELQETSEAADCARRLNTLYRLRDKAFFDDVDKQISDLSALKTSARQLTENAVQAFDLFKKTKSSVITRRVVSSEKKNRRVGGRGYAG